LNSSRKSPFSARELKPLRKKIWERTENYVHTTKNQKLICVEKNTYSKTTLQLHISAPNLDPIYFAKKMSLNISSICILNQAIKICGSVDLLSDL